MIIGIGGVSRAGKTTLANQIAVKFQEEGKATDIFCQDDYVKSKISLPKVQGFPDWERPNSIKWDSLTRALEKSEADIKIVEGLFSFYPASLLTLYDLKFFLEIEKEVFTKRRQQDKRWEEEPDWYADHVWRSYLKYGMTKGNKADYLFLDGTIPFDVDEILSKAYLKN